MLRNLYIPLLTALMLLAACQNSAGKSSLDVTPPDSTAALFGDTSGRRVSLRWTNPNDADFAGTIVTRSAAVNDEMAPTRGTAYSVGDQIGTGTVIAVLDRSATAFVDEQATEGTHTYRLFSFDGARNWASAQKFTLRVDVTAPTEGVSEFLGTSIGGGLSVRLRWSKPSGDPDFAYVKLVRKFGEAPTSLTDGTVVYFGAGVEFIDTSVPNDGAWYYAIFACDERDNCMQNGSIVSVTRVPGSGNMTLTVDKKWGAQDFALNTALSAGGHTYQFSELRYWLSNVELVREDDTTYKVPNSYYLMTEHDTLAGAVGDTSSRGVPNVDVAAGKRETVSLTGIEPGVYKGIRFGIGVDDTYNNDLTLHAGELHAYNHMSFISWMWMTSYIFMRAKGECTTCTAVLTTSCTPDAAGGRGFQYDVGNKQNGAVAPSTNYRTVTMAFPEALTVHLAKSTHVELELDVAKIIAPEDIADAVDPNVVDVTNACWLDARRGNKVTRVVDPIAPDGFANMTKLADNVQRAFNLRAVTQENDSSPGMAPVVLRMPFKFGAADFSAGDNTFVDGNGNTLRFSQARFWLSNVRLQHADGEYLVPGSYYLMTHHGELSDEPYTVAAGSRDTVVINDVPVGAYTGIRFSIGVDPGYNDDLSLQAGELHMVGTLTDNSWMWRTSYIFSRATGICVSCGNEAFAWDVGGNEHYEEVPALSFASPIVLTAAGDAAIDIAFDMGRVMSAANLATVKTVSAASNASTMSSISAKFAEAFSLIGAVAH